MLDSNLINIQSLYCSTLNSRDFKCTWEQVSCRIRDHGVPVKVSSGSRQSPHPLLPVAYRRLHQGFPRVISHRIHWSTLRGYTVAGFVPVGLHSSLWTFQKGCRFSTLKAWIISQSLQYVSLSFRFSYYPFLVLHDNTLDGKVSALGLGKGGEKRGSESREGGRTFNKKKNKYSETVQACSSPADNFQRSIKAKMCSSWRSGKMHPTCRWTSFNLKEWARTE